jgi:hypothetical protein
MGKKVQYRLSLYCEPGYKGSLKSLFSDNFTGSATSHWGATALAQRQSGRSFPTTDNRMKRQQNQVPKKQLAILLYKPLSAHQG